MERAREGVAVLLNDSLHSVVIFFGCVGSRILRIKFKFSRVKFVRWMGTAPVKEWRGSGMTWTRLWIE